VKPVRESTALYFEVSLTFASMVISQAIHRISPAWAITRFRFFVMAAGPDRTVRIAHYKSHYSSD